MVERFTEKARQVVHLAQDEARYLRHNYIGAEHLLLGIMRERGGLGHHVLRDLGVKEDHLRQWIIKTIGKGDEGITGQMPFTPRAKKILELSLREALSLGHNYVGTEHVLLGLAREPDGMAALYLRELGIDSEQIRQAVIQALRGSENSFIPITPLQQVQSILSTLKDVIKKLELAVNKLERDE